jgi:hypothetical protein
MSANRVSILIAAVAAVAIVVVVAAGSGFDLPSLGGDDDNNTAARETSPQDAPEQADTPEPADSPDGADTPAPAGDAHGGGHETGGGADPEAQPEPAPAAIPDDPDAVRGTDAFALTRPANLRRALAVLDRRRRAVRGAFDGLRIAPGRIDTVIVHPDDRRTNIQVRADLEVAFESTHDFPTRAGFRKGGLTARDVDVRAPARLLRGIDRRRRGSAARDVDYIVIGKDIIGFRVDVTAYMRIRTARPRYFRLEGGRVEAFG